MFQRIEGQLGSPGVTFSQDRDIDQSLQALITRLLLLGPNCSNVVSWCIEIDRTDGLVYQALSAALELLLHDYMLLVC